MKLYRIVKVAMLALPLVFAACGSHKKTIKTPVSMTPDVRERVNFISSVQENAQTAKFITSKVKFSVEVGPQKLTLTGNLKMKRDDVIRLQLMAFGFVEAGRLEFTPDYVLIIDRINKQYLKVPYAHLDFLRNSHIDFYVIQSLFWNELFQPGKSHLTDSNMKSYKTELGADDDVVIAMEDGKLSYRWLTEQSSKLVEMANIMYNDRFRGNYQLNWDYEDFQRINSKHFPMLHKVGLITPQKEIKFEMMLSKIDHEENWETRTMLSGKYRQVEVDEILRRFMAL